MKLLFTAIILGTTGAVLAQDAPPAPPAPPIPPVAARLAVLPAVAGDVFVAGATKNAPFTADESGETVRVMADGNRIVNNWTGKVARNSEGRIRRELTSGDAAGRPVIVAGGLASPAAVAIGAGEGMNHVVRTKVETERAVSARTVVTPAAEHGAVTVVSTGGHDAKSVTVVSPEARMAIEHGAVSVAGAKHAADGKVQTRKESLGTRDFGGVQADGHRSITTYAAGAIGNEREFEITSEVWFSKDLGVVVYTKRNDPRSGETTYQMTNIVRAEPDASLFPTKK